MSGYKQSGRTLFDPVTGTVVGFIDNNGTEQIGLGGPGGAAVTVVNDLTTGGATAALSAQMGVTLNTALAAKASAASPTLTNATLAGTTAAPTVATTDNSQSIATTQFVQAFVQNALVGMMDLRGSLAGNTSPSYPAAVKGDSYLFSTAGFVGGASGKAVNIGDVAIAIAANAGGLEASVGTSWIVLEHAIAGALLAANNLSDLSSAATAWTNLGGAAKAQAAAALMNLSQFAQAGAVAGQVWMATSPTAASFQTPATSGAGNAPVTVTVSSNLTAAAHANRTIYADSTTPITLTIQTGGWVDGDTVYVVAKNLSSGKITIADLLGAIKPNYSPIIDTPGCSVKLRFDATTSKWQSMDMSMFQTTNGTSTVAVTNNATDTIHYSMAGYSDILFTASKIELQTGNSGHGLAPTVAKIFVQSTLTYAPPAGDQQYSHAGIGAETTYYDNANRVSMYLHTYPAANIETVFPNATEIGERNRFVVSGGNGLIIGSDANNSFNGKWSQYDTWGNASFLRSWGNASRQKSVATTGTVTIAMGVTNLILAGSGAVTVALPATPYDGQIASLQFRTAYTGITMSGNGMTVTTGTAVGITAGSFASFRFDATDSNWDRMG